MMEIEIIIKDTIHGKNLSNMITLAQQLKE